HDAQGRARAVRTAAAYRAERGSRGRLARRLSRAPRASGLNTRWTWSASVRTGISFPPTAPEGRFRVRRRRCKPAGLLSDGTVHEPRVSPLRVVTRSVAGYLARRFPLETLGVGILLAFFCSHALYGLTAGTPAVARSTVLGAAS